MGIFSFLNRFRKVKPQVTPQLISKKKRVLGKPKPKKYVATCDLVYNGTSIRQFDVREVGYSRDAVAKKIESGFEIKVVKINVK